ncbi:hypothetical protein ACVWZL_002750 [Bradyrhizobium sp. GM2.4]
MGDPVGIAPTRNGHPALAEFWRAMGHGAQRGPVGSRRRGFFIFQATMPAIPSIANVAGYAAVGALYFLVSAVWLTVGEWRRSAAV